MEDFTLIKQSINVIIAKYLDFLLQIEEVIPLEKGEEALRVMELAQLLWVWIAIYENTDSLEMKILVSPFIEYYAKKLDKSLDDPDSQK